MNFAKAGAAHHCDDDDCQGADVVLVSLKIYLSSVMQERLFHYFNPVQNQYKTSFEVFSTSYFNHILTWNEKHENY